MNRSTIKSMTAALIGGACLLAATPGWGAAYTLRADEFTKVVPLPGGGTTNIHMWGFALGAEGAPASPGPVLTVPPADTVLTITLTNALTVPVSLVIPNQNGYVRGGVNEHVTFNDSEGRARASSFVKQTLPGQTVIYTWNNVQPGTYLYYSGTHSALQVQMGLYGRMSKNASAIQAYPGVAFGSQVDWIFGEIDFDVHAAVLAGTYDTAIKSMIHSVPEIYLVNGAPLTGGVGTLPGSNLGLPTLVRMSNVCYDERIPVVSGYHFELIAEDGRLYPYRKIENAANLPSLKTRDALLRRPTGGAGATRFYDRRLLSMQ